MFVSFRAVALFLLLAASVHAAAPTDQIAWWKLDETTGTSVADTTANASTGTQYGAAPVWGAGKVGNALTFNGTDNYVSFGNGATLRPSTGESVCAWYKSTTTPTHFVSVL